MSHHDGYTYEMGLLESVSDRDLERLLAGKARHGDEELEALTSFVRDIRDTYTVSPDELTEARHIAAIVEAAHLVADKGKPVARPASKADGPVQQEPRLPKWRRKPVFDWWESIVARVVVSGIAVAATTGGLAYAGALPEPVQEAAVDVADAVGVTLPDPDEPSQDENDDAPTVVVDELEAVEPEDPEGVQSDEEDDDPDDEGTGDDETNGAAAAGAGAAADNADDSADTETAGGANQAAAGADDSDDDTDQQQQQQQQHSSSSSNSSSRKTTQKTTQKAKTTPKKCPRTTN